MHIASLRHRPQEDVSDEDTGKEEKGPVRGKRWGIPHAFLSHWSFTSPYVACVLGHSDPLTSPVTKPAGEIMYLGLAPASPVEHLSVPGQP